jgi:predicted dienelactone hydrolase
VEGKRQFPVVVYSPAFGIERDMYWFNISNLVDNGYIVVTVGATYESVFTVFPDQKNIKQLKSLSNLKSTDFAGWERLLEIRIQDIVYVMGALQKINATDELLRDKLDLQCIGLIGHSLGGAAVYRVLKKDLHIKSCILMDPSLHLLGFDTAPISTPVLLMRQNSSIYEMLVKDGWNELLARETMNGQARLATILIGYNSFIKIQEANHVTFSDVPIHFNVPGTSARHRSINSLILSFFNEFVCDQTGEYTRKNEQFSGSSPIDLNGNIIDTTKRKGREVTNDEFDYS